ncbi:unnamed protein product (macronuclear) [Paramecium tetraurelia]|uniref:UBA domain-containing protein n=1 Tax=Paramecium tetraurelia TaxID=5888 RepID=A0DAV3_PARTE|nr:uncharacterized protein GSPATT00015077001 [Paramecium tetraurelia]CAK80170.1 unnamed protein product [Paramecium tetraurelia]|eukprot:XP_001447567.1 hypothetical protein (macronuclear) [Paramecium tetraurelia strain d4-2]
MFNYYNQKEKNAVETLLSLGITEESLHEIDYDKEIKKLLRRTQSNSLADARKIIINLTQSNLHPPQNPSSKLNSPINDFRCRTELRTISLYKPQDKILNPLIQQNKFVITQVKTNRIRHSSEYKTVQVQTVQVAQTMQEFNFNFVEKNSNLESKKFTKSLPKYFLRFKKRQH